MHCILKPGFPPLHMDSAHCAQRDIFSLHNKPIQIPKKPNLDYWNQLRKACSVSSKSEYYNQNSQNNSPLTTSRILHDHNEFVDFHVNLYPPHYPYAGISPGNGNNNGVTDTGESNSSSSNSSSLKSNHLSIRPIWNAGSAEQLTSVLGRIEKYEVIEEPSSEATDEFRFEAEPNYRRNSSCGSIKSDRFHPHRLPPLPRSPIDQFYYKLPSSSCTTLIGIPVEGQVQNHHHQDQEQQDQYHRRHSFTASSGLKPPNKFNNYILDGHHRNHHPYKISSSYSVSPNHPSGAYFFADKRQSLPSVSIAATMSQAPDNFDKEPPFKHNKRRESVSSLSDDNHDQCQDDFCQHSEESNPDHPRSNARRDSEVSLTTCETDLAEFLFVGPCGKKRKIIRDRQRQMSEPTDSNPEIKAAIAAASTRHSCGHSPVKQEPRDIVEVREDEEAVPENNFEDLPLNLCISDETVEKVRNLSIQCSSTIPIQYFSNDERTAHTSSSINFLPPILHRQFMGLGISDNRPGPSHEPTPGPSHEPTPGPSHEPTPANRERSAAEASIRRRQAVAARLEKKRLKCPDCPKEFSQLRNFRYHRSQHEGTAQFACTCPVCGKHFNDKGYLSSHLKIHRNAKEYHCEWCPKKFNQRVAYNMHIRIHTGLKPHECTMCNKCFSRKMLLRQHVRTHTGERPYKCEVCDKCFADRSNMLLHKRLHTGERPYKCHICEKTFSKNHHLKTHMNHHAGIKPYQCQKCKASFSQSSNMKTHFKKCSLVTLDNAAAVGAAPIPTITTPIERATVAGRSPKSKSPTPPKSTDHVSVIAHTRNTTDQFLQGSPDLANRRRSNPYAGQPSFYESHHLQPQQHVDFRKHSASFSGPSTSYGTISRQLFPPLQQQQDPRLAARRNPIDLETAIRFSIARVEAAPLARLAHGPQHDGSSRDYTIQRHNMAQPYYNPTRRASSPSVYHHQYQHHVAAPPPSPTGDILRNSLLNRAPHQYETGQSAATPATANVQIPRPDEHDRSSDEAESPIDFDIIKVDK